jgi:hypothetical protein
MKKMLIIALLFCVKSAFAQKDTIGLNVPYANGSVGYEKVFNVPNTTQNLLYSNAELWMAENHPYILETQPRLNDPALFRVVGIANASCEGSDKVLWSTQIYYYNYKFTVQIDCKDNAYRVRIYDIQLVTDKTYTPIDDLMQSLINSKSYTLGNGGVMKTKDFQTCFKDLNIVVNNVMTQIKNNITADNSF